MIGPDEVSLALQDSPAEPETNPQIPEKEPTKLELVIEIDKLLSKLPEDKADEYISEGVPDTIPGLVRFKANLEQLISQNNNDSISESEVPISSDFAEVTEQPEPNKPETQPVETTTELEGTEFKGVEGLKPDDDRLKPSNNWETDTVYSSPLAKEFVGSLKAAFAENKTPLNFGAAMMLIADKLNFPAEAKRKIAEYSNYPTDTVMNVVNLAEGISFNIVRSNKGFDIYLLLAETGELPDRKMHLAKLNTNFSTSSMSLNVLGEEDSIYLIQTEYYTSGINADFDKEGFRTTLKAGVMKKFSSQEQFSPGEITEILRDYLHMGSYTFGLETVLREIDKEDNTWQTKLGDKDLMVKTVRSGGTVVLTLRKGEVELPLIKIAKTEQGKLTVTAAEE